MKLFSYFKDFLAPKKCTHCSSLGAFLCQDCLKIVPKNNPYCYVCKMPSLDFEVHRKCKNGFFLEALIVPYHYREKLIKSSITAGKFYKKSEVFEEIANYISPYI